METNKLKLPILYSLLLIGNIFEQNYQTVNVLTMFPLKTIEIVELYLLKYGSY